ncbi:hypothetical protein RFI_22084, partial [Reticulomyxa filosa]
EILLLNSEKLSDIAIIVADNVLQMIYQVFFVEILILLVTKTFNLLVVAIDKERAKSNKIRLSKKFLIFSNNKRNFLCQWHLRHNQIKAIEFLQSNATSDKIRILAQTVQPFSLIETATRQRKQASLTVIVEPFANGSASRLSVKVGESNATKKDEEEVPDEIDIHSSAFQAKSITERVSRVVLSQSFVQEEIENLIEDDGLSLRQDTNTTIIERYLVKERFVSFFSLTNLKNVFFS